MAYYVGLDIGTTHITALVLDAERGDVTAVVEAPNETEITAAPDKARGRSEWDALAMVQLAWQVLRQAVVKADLPAGESLAGIGISNQMHGVVVIDEAGEPLTPFIGWQDQRGQEQQPGRNQTYLAAIQALANDTLDDEPSSIMATGYMGTTLFWLQKNDFRFPEGARACFIGDLTVAWLTGTAPCTDATNAASSGLFDVANRRWDIDLIRVLGLSPDILPTLCPAPAFVEVLRPELANADGGSHVPVAVAIGDNQASFAGSVADPAVSLALNIGTGGQLSAYHPTYIEAENAETRPYVGSGYLLVQASLCGGRAYALLQRFFQAVGEAFFDATGQEDLYEMMSRLAAQVPPGSEDVTCRPRFAGTREDPGQRASWTGLGEKTFTPAHLTRSLLEGLIAEFVDHYVAMQRNGLSPRTWLIGSGNGLRRNPILQRIAAHAFGLPLRIPIHQEEAAYGAALVAAVADGQFSSLDEAGQLIRYQEPNTSPR